MRVLSVASEAYPLVKTGGLADVVGALPAALAAHGVEVRTLLPGYPAVVAAMQGALTVWTEQGYFGGPARLLAGRAGGLDLFVLDAPHLYARPGNPYVAPDGADWPDNPQRFAALAYAAALIGQGAAVPGPARGAAASGVEADEKEAGGGSDTDCGDVDDGNTDSATVGAGTGAGATNAAGWVPDVVHAHDWQTGLAPAYLALAGGPRPGTVFTLHNLAFQGQVPTSLLAELRLPASAYTPDGVEYYGAIGMLKAGLRYADRITTVSPSYAAEICTKAGGMGMDGLLRARAGVLTGILNGIDTAVWDPATDPLLPARYSASARSGRAACKAALQTRFGLTPGRTTLLFGVVSRLSDQKGLDLLLDCLPVLLECGAQLALIGSGDPGLQDGFAQAARTHAGQVGVLLGYDEPTAHLLQAGSDAVLVPSRFEPCGLTQLCALCYGAVPVVSRVGGLADSVIDANAAALAAGVATGVQFAPVTAAALAGVIRRTAALWQDRRAWVVMQSRGMRTDVSWAGPAGAYARVYEEARKQAVLF